ncbi:hypothetical protein [Segniliparus rotundus]|uniref:hypothetical protein n=1 Tax=Segniliparus rotundus TaxID=286802 RepID=UPI0002D309DB|nr:hypothetical protein [Segniliparus rotundus]
MNGDGWHADSRKWGYYEEEDDEDHFVQRAAPLPSSHGDSAMPPAPKQEPARPHASAALDPAEAVSAAQRMAGDLAAQSSSYPGISWAVSVLEEAGQAIFYATSNEGAGYLPPGLRWDTRLQHVFGPAVPRTQLPLWLGLANPARTVADHYFFLRGVRPGLRLHAIISTQPPGEAVAAMLSKLGATSLPPTGAGPGSRPARAVHRLHAVSDGNCDALIEAIPVRQLWSAGLDLAEDAARRHGYRRLEPQLAAALDGLRSGRAHPAQADHAWRRLWQLTAQAQASRVQDAQLGPIEPGSGNLTFQQAIRLGAGFAYAEPFFTARTTAILYPLLRCRIFDEPLGEEQLAEMAYEHACLADDVAPACAVLARHSATGEDDL